MKGSAPVEAVFVSPGSLPLRMAAASRVLLGVSTFRAWAPDGAPDCAVARPLSAGGGSTGAGVRGTMAVSEAGADGAAGATGRTGGLPASAAFGSQFLLCSASAASCSGVRCWPLLSSGTLAFVTYSATPSATARPTSRPTIKPRAKPPRWFFKEGFTRGSERSGGGRGGGFVAAHLLGRAHAQDGQRVAQHLGRGLEQREPS